jgi:1-acyl-sn-glycerol-3-phosphate acyltransferase
MLHGLRPVAAWVVRRRWELHQHGMDRVPRTGPVIFAPNHSGWLDGPLLVITSPRPVHALTKQEEFAGPLGLVLRGPARSDLTD